MFKVYYKGQYKAPKFSTFQEAFEYCKLQAPLITGFYYSHFTIESEEYEWEITFRKPCECIYKRCRKIIKPSNNGQPLPMIIHYGGSDQFFYSDNERNEAIEKIKEMAPKMVGGFVVLKRGNEMWKSSFDGKNLHHKACKEVNGEFIEIN